MKKVLALLCAAVFLLSFETAAFAEASSRPAPAVVAGETYISDHLPGASALYVSGQQVTLDNAYFYGAGYASDQEITDQIPNQYGLCAVVLAAGQGTEVTLNNPTIVSDPESYANGVFAAGMAKVTINGGTINTDNSSGHGIDATFMGHVYAYDTVIHTKGETSGALATDFGGGFITGERLDCATESGSAPGIFCAGSTVITIKDSKFTTATATGIVVAHDHAVVVLDNCEVNAAGTAVSGLQALPNAASSDGSSFYAFGGKLTSRGGAVVGEAGGRTVINLIGTECAGGSEEAISCKSNGILTVNLWDTELTGSIDCAEGCSITVNLYQGGKLSGEVTGDGEVIINVYDGGEYNGSFAANQGGAGEAAPVLGSFDDYLLSCWATGSQTWTASRGQQYVNSIEPAILENSAAALVTAGAAAQPYDPASYDPSENGVDLSLLNVGGAYGFSVEEIFGVSGMPSGDEGFGGSEGGPSGDGFGGSFGGSSDEGFGDSFGGSSGQPAGTPEETTNAQPEEEADAASQATENQPEQSAAAPASSSVVDIILNVGTAQAFTDEAVSVDDLKTILNAGLAAASAINQQPWYFVAVTNQELMQEIAGSGMGAAAPAGTGNADFAPSDGGAAGEGFGASDGASSGEGFGASDGGSAAPAAASGAKAGVGDSPAAIVIYRNDKSSSPNADFDCGLATQNMVIAAASLGYGVKIVSSPTMTLNGANHDALCEKMGVDPSMQAVAVLLIGRTDVDAVASASVRETLETKTSIIE